MGRKWGYNSVWSPQPEAGPNDVEVIWEVDSDAGYDWSTVAIVTRLYGTTRQYAVYSDSGCSCNLPYDTDPGRLDWQIDTKVIRNQARKAIEDAYHIDNTLDAWFTMRTKFDTYLRDV